MILKGSTCNLEDFQTNFCYLYFYLYAEIDLMCVNCVCIVKPPFLLAVGSSKIYITNFNTLQLKEEEHLARKEM